MYITIFRDNSISEQIDRCSQFKYNLDKCDCRELEVDYHPSFQKSVEIVIDSRMKAILHGQFYFQKFLSFDPRCSFLLVSICPEILLEADGSEKEMVS